MTLTTTIYDLVILTSSNILAQAGWIALGIWDVKKITQSLKEVAKDIPSWIDRYFKEQLKLRRIDDALSMRKL